MQRLEKNNSGPIFVSSPAWDKRDYERFGDVEKSLDLAVRGNKGIWIKADYQKTTGELSCEKWFSPVKAVIEKDHRFK